MSKKYSRSTTFHTKPDTSIWKICNKNQKTVDYLFRIKTGTNAWPVRRRRCIRSGFFFLIWKQYTLYIEGEGVFYKGFH
jgi:hypothetical protein